MPANTSDIFDSCFVLSFVLLCISAVLCAVWNYVLHRKHLAKYPVLRPVNVFTLCAVFAFFLLFIPNAFNTNNENIFIAIISSVRDVMDNLSFGNSLNAITTAINVQLNEASSSEWLSFCYVTFLSFLIPVLTARAAVMVFRDVLTQARFLFNRKDSFYIFSDLSERSVQLGAELAEMKNTKVIFTGIDRTSSSDRYLVEQARKMNALLTKRTVNGLQISDRFSKTPVCIGFLSEDENKNIKDAADKFEAIKTIRRNVRLCVFSVSDIAREVVNALNASDDSQEIFVHAELFNEAQRMAYNLLFEHPWYEVNSNEDTIRVMILGAGFYGLEVAKAVAWSSFSSQKKVRIRIFDEKDKTEELGFPFFQLAKRLQKIGTRCDLSFHCCDVFSTAFDEHRFASADYIFIALGDDDNKNIAAALQMRKLYARGRTQDGFIPETQHTPKIFIRLNSNVADKIARSMNDFDSVPYATLEKVYRKSVFVDWQIDRMAQFVHAAYDCYYKIRHKNAPKTQAFTLFEKAKKDYCKQPEINKLSSRAAAVHYKYKLSELGLGMTKEELLSDQTASILQENMEQLMRVEHDRWNAFQMLDGWDAWDISDDHLHLSHQHKSVSAKLHAYMAPFDELPDIAHAIYGGNADPREYDRVIIGIMPYAVVYGMHGEISAAELQAFFEQLFNL